jgi:hypothetical protein
VVIIAVRRQDRREALAGLRVDDDRIVVNVMSGVANDDPRRTLATGAALVRAIPLPAVRERRSVTVTYPSHPVTDALFEHLGGALPIADEAAFNVFSTLSGTLTTTYAGSSRDSAAPWTTRPAPWTSSPPTTRRRTGTTSASAPRGSPRPTPKPSTRPSTASSPTWRSRVEG